MVLFLTFFSLVKAGSDCYNAHNLTEKLLGIVHVFRVKFRKVLYAKRPKAYQNSTGLSDDEVMSKLHQADLAGSRTSVVE